MSSDGLGAGVGIGIGAGTGAGLPAFPGQGQDPGSVAALGPEPAFEPEPQLPAPAPESEPEPELPPDPASLALDAILDLPGQEAIRRVYQLATSAARTKARVAASLDRLDARTYHDLLSKTPEARFATELIAARRRLDALAQERRNLNLELAAGAALEPRRRMLEVQTAACTMAMEQVAAGTLIYLALPSDTFLSEPTPEASPEVEQPAQSQVQQPEQSTTQTVGDANAA